MQIALASLLFFAFTLSGADLTGIWTGTFTIQGQNGEEKASSAHLNLKQSGADLTGTAGPNETEQWEISKGKVEADRITFEVQQPNEGARLRFDLRLVNDRIQGDVTAEKEGDNRKAKLDVSRKQE